MLRIKQDTPNASLCPSQPHGVLEYMNYVSKLVLQNPRLRTPPNLFPESAEASRILKRYHSIPCNSTHFLRSKETHLSKVTKNKLHHLDLLPSI